MRDATDRQLDYLSELGYDGRDPDYMHVASMAIDMMKASKSSGETEKAVLKADQAAFKKATKKKRSCLGSCLVTGFVLTVIAAGWLAFFYWIK